MTIDVSLHPKSQVSLVGHQAAYTQILQGFKNKTLPPVWLFSGERGIGKATLAYALARKILEEQAQSPEQVARQIAVGSYPNFLCLERSFNPEGKMPREIMVEEVRKIIPFLRQCAALPGWRVVILDGAEEMNRNAANALLKILEEPPAETVFFLITHSLGKVLPTIRSRSCTLQLSRLRKEEIAGHLPCHLPTTTPEENFFDETGSLGKTLAFHTAGGVKLYNQVIQAMESVLKGDWRPAQALGHLFDKDNPLADFVLELISYILYRLIIEAHMAFHPIKSLATLASKKAMSHWVEAYQRIDRFLYEAHNSHLDRTHIMMAVFFIIENPATGDEFIYG